MKRNNINLYVAALLIATLVFSFLTIYAFGEHKASGISLSARSAVLYQPDTDNFLYSKDADTRLPMASTTKTLIFYTSLSQLQAEKREFILSTDT